MKTNLRDKMQSYIKNVAEQNGHWKTIQRAETIVKKFDQIQKYWDDIKRENWELKETIKSLSWGLLCSLAINFFLLYFTPSPAR